MFPLLVKSADELWVGKWEIQQCFPALLDILVNIGSELQTEQILQGFASCLFCEQEVWFLGANTSSGFCADSSSWESICSHCRAELQNHCGEQLVPVSGVCLLKLSMQGKISIQTLRKKCGHVIYFSSFPFWLTPLYQNTLQQVTLNPIFFSSFLPW